MIFHIVRRDLVGILVTIIGIVLLYVSLSALNIETKDIVGIIIAFIGVMVAFITLTHQVRDAQRAMEAQNYVSILDRADRIGLSVTMDFLRRELPNSPGLIVVNAGSPEEDCTVNPNSPEFAGRELTLTPQERAHYEQFYTRRSPDEKQKVRAIMDFFNDVAHLMRYGYVDDRYVMRLYFPSMRACACKLALWWIKGIRDEQRNSNLYINFEALCLYILSLKGTEREWPRYRNWRRSRGYPE